MMKTIQVDEYFEAGLLKASGYKFAGAEVSPSTGRVVMTFEDDGKAQDILDKHRDGNLSLGTLDFASGIMFAKSALFRAKDKARSDATGGQ